MKTITIYNRGEIMREAWRIARKTREEKAHRAHALGARVIGSRIVYARPFAAVLAETPLDLSAAMKAAWAAVKQADTKPQGGALIVVHHSGTLAPPRRRFARVWPLLLTAARFLSANFIPSRAA